MGKKRTEPTRPVTMRLSVAAHAAMLADSKKTGLPYSRLVSKLIEEHFGLVEKAEIVT